MDKIDIIKDDVTNVTYIKSNNKESDFTIDLLEHFLKRVLFKPTVYVFITFTKSMELLSYDMLEVEVDNIHGFTIPLSELNDKDLQDVSIMGMTSVNEALRWIERNKDSYLEEVGNMDICIELPYDGIINNVSSVEIIEDINKMINTLDTDRCSITIGSKYGKY